MKVTLAANHGEFGGGEMMLIATARALRELGHEVSVVAPSAPTAVVDAALEARFPTIAIRGNTTTKYLAGLRRWDASERRGILWANGLRPAFATSGHPERIVHLHQVPGGPQRAAAVIASRGALRILVPSATMQQSMKLGSHVLENWTLPLAGVARPPFPATGPYTLGFLGRPSVDKGVVVLAAALRLLEERQPGAFRLLLAGEPRFVSKQAESEVETALRPVAHLVDRTGWIQREDFFSRVDLAVFPSVWPEPFGLVVAEAMSALCPFVISDAGALPLVAGEEHPWVSRAGDPASLADVIVRACSDSSHGEVAQARARWEQRFSPESALRRLKLLMDQVGEET